MIVRYSATAVVLALTQAFLAVSAGASPSYSEPEPGELRSVPDTHPRAYLSARDHLTVGDTARALTLLERSVTTFPHHEPSLTLYLTLRETTGGTGAVFEVVRDHYERVGRSDRFENFFRSVRRDTGRFEPVLEWLNTRSVHPYFSRLLARDYLERGNDTAAEALLGDALEAFPNDSNLGLLLAEVLARRSKCPSALKRVNQLIRRRPGWAPPYRLKANMLRSNRKREARKLMETYNNLSGSSAAPGSDFHEEFSCSFR